MPADPQFNSPASSAIDLRASEHALVGLLAADSLDGDALFEVTRRALLAIQDFDIHEAERFIAVVRQSLEPTTPEAAVAVASLKQVSTSAGQMSHAILYAKEGRTSRRIVRFGRYVARFSNTIGAPIAGLATMKRLIAGI
jgi:hypothetical protein